MTVPQHIPDLEARAIAFHEQSVGDATELWRDGLNLLLRGFDPLAGRKPSRDEELAQVALLVQAWQTLTCAFNVALAGYYPQSLNLVRSPLEYWLAYWYLRSFPHEFKRFLNLQESTPSFNDMLQKMESKHGRTEKPVRAWRKRLNSFSHVDRLPMRVAITEREDGNWLAVGPQQDARVFRGCAAEAGLLICALLEALDNLRRLVGLAPLEGYPEFDERFREWQTEQIGRLSG